MKLVNKNILITGGAGFIGTHLYENLLLEGANVHIFDNLSEQIHGNRAIFTDHRVTFTKGDVTNTADIMRVIDNIDIVFHLAAETGTGQSMYEINQYVHVNEIGTARLLEAVVKSRKKDISFVLASSRSIYGEGAYLSENGDRVQPNTRSKEQLVLNEWELTDSDGACLIPVGTPSDLPPNPGSVYAATKYSQEMLVKVVCQTNHIPCTILRFQNVYGEGQSLRNPYTGIISIFYNRMRQGLPINIFEDGYESRDFVHVSDVVNALVSSITCKTSLQPVIANIGSGEATTVLDIAKLLAEISGIDIPIEVSGDYRIGDIRHCYADLECARHFLNFRPKITLYDGLSRFVDWASQQSVYKDESDRAMTELAEHGLSS